MRKLILIILLVVSTGTLYASFDSTTRTIASVPRYFYIQNERQWDEIAGVLRTTASKNILIYWKGDGGLLSLGDKFINAMSRAQASGKTVRFIITGPAISMHAKVICYGNSYRMTENGSLLFHMARTSEAGAKRIKYMKNDSFLDMCVRKGILSSREAYRITNDHKSIIITHFGQHVEIDEN